MGEENLDFVGTLHFLNLVDGMCTIFFATQLRAAMLISTLREKRMYVSYMISPNPHFKSGR